MVLMIQLGEICVYNPGLNRVCSLGTQRRKQLRLAQKVRNDFSGKRNLGCAFKGEAIV